MTYHSRQDETSEWLNYLQPEGLVVGPNVLRERGAHAHPPDAARHGSRGAGAAS